MKKIIFDNVSKVFENGLVVLDKVSLEVNERDSMIILGTSGTGKSVMLKLLLGLMNLTSGDIIVDGISVHDRRKKDEYRSKFSVLFQGGALFDSMTVLENVVFNITQRDGKQKNPETLAAKTLSSVGIKEEAFNLYPSSLSGGMQKRVALARAISVKPEIILFDEPTSGLDPVTSSKIAFLIRDMLEEINTTSLTITHDLNVARCLGSIGAMLDRGKIIWNDKIENFDTADNEYVQNFVQASRWNKK